MFLACVAETALRGWEVDVVCEEVVRQPYVMEKITAYAWLLGYIKNSCRVLSRVNPLATKKGSFQPSQNREMRA